MGCVSDAPIAQIDPAPDSAVGQLKPPLPMDADSDRLGNSCAVATPTSAAAACTTASATSTSGRDASSSDGTTTGTCAGTASVLNARSSGAWSGLRPSSTAKAWRVACHCARSPGSDASSVAASWSASSASFCEADPNS
ncbi:hypothetical protein G6F22_017881 [Rhizopus arrhizus]|nr:hypothetical protein G6F22_017881 [Rhizopus arrhizus]